MSAHTALQTLGNLVTVPRSANRFDGMAPEER